MDDDELAARLAGLRIAVAFAIKASCRHPAEVQARTASLQEIAGLVPGSLHPGVRAELEAIIAAMGRLPVRDPTVQQAWSAAAAPQHREARLPEAEPIATDDLLGEIL